MAITYRKERTIEAKFVEMHALFEYDNLVYYKVGDDFFKEHMIASELSEAQDGSVVTRYLTISYTTKVDLIVVYNKK